MDTDGFDPDVWKRMDYMHSRPDGGETRGVDTVDLVYMCRTVAQDEQRLETDDNSDADSVAEWEYSTWDDACAWEFRNAPVNIPLGLIQNPPTDIIRNYTDDDEYPEKFGRGGCVDSTIHPPWFWLGQQYCRGDSEIQNNANMTIRGSYPKLTNCRHTEYMDCLPHAVCYDCVCLMPLIWITMPLSSDGDGTVNRTGHDRDYDGSPAGLLGCLPRRLCLLWVMEGMTQLQTKINRPYSDILLHKTMDGGGRRDVWISDTPPVTHAVKGFSLALIGRWASVGGSVVLADWSCLLGMVDNPPGGVWIDFIRRTVEDSQSIVVAPVTGSLVSPTLFSCRDANCTYRSSIFCVNCDTDWILPAGYQVLLLEHAEGGTMDADGFLIVDNRAGVTSGV